MVGERHEVGYLGVHVPPIGGAYAPRVRARTAYDLELHYLSVLCSMQGVGGRWRKAPASRSRFSPPESSGAARLTGAPRKPGGTVGIGSRARRDGAKRPLYSDRHVGRLLRSIALLSRREADRSPCVGCVAKWI